jgi:flagellar hook-length control protein FliK
MQRSGALTVSVRSTDTSLTKALQQNLPDLNNKLNDQQVRTEWWTPGASQLQSSQKTNESSANPGSGHSGSQNQGDQNKGNASQQDGRGAPKPDWVEQLSDFSNSNQNGKQYSWHL